MSAKADWIESLVLRFLRESASASALRASASLVRALWRFLSNLVEKISTLLTRGVLAPASTLVATRVCVSRTTRSANSIEYSSAVKVGTCEPSERRGKLRARCSEVVSSLLVSPTGEPRVAHDSRMGCHDNRRSRRRNSIHIVTNRRKFREVTE